MGAEGGGAAGAGVWLPMGEAARALGVAERTLRRHVRAGRYPTRPGPGRRVLVRLPPPAPAAPPADPVVGAVAALAEELAVERTRGDRLAIRLGTMGDEVARLASAARSARPPSRRTPRGQPALVPGELRRYEPHGRGTARPNPFGVIHPNPA